MSVNTTRLMAIAAGHNQHQVQVNITTSIWPSTNRNSQIPARDWGPYNRRFGRIWKIPPPDLDDFPAKNKQNAYVV